MTTYELLQVAPEATDDERVFVRVGVWYGTPDGEPHLVTDFSLAAPQQPYAPVFNPVGFVRLKDGSWVTPMRHDEASDRWVRDFTGLDLDLVPQPHDPSAELLAVIESVCLLQAERDRRGLDIFDPDHLPVTTAPRIGHAAETLRVFIGQRRMVG